MQASWVYIQANWMGWTIYIGVTTDLVRRVWEHRTGAVPGFTKRYELKRLVFFEEHASLTAAIQREKTLKHWSRTWKMSLIETSNPAWDDLWPGLL